MFNFGDFFKFFLYISSIRNNHTQYCVVLNVNIHFNKNSNHGLFLDKKEYKKNRTAFVTQIFKISYIIFCKK